MREMETLREARAREANGDLPWRSSGLKNFMAMVNADRRRGTELCAELAGLLSRLTGYLMATRLDIAELEEIVRDAMPLIPLAGHGVECREHMELGEPCSCGEAERERWWARVRSRPSLAPHEPSETVGDARVSR